MEQTVKTVESESSQPLTVFETLPVLCDRAPDSERHTGVGPLVGLMCQPGAVDG